MTNINNCVWAKGDDIAYRGGGAGGGGGFRKSGAKKSSGGPGNDEEYEEGMEEYEEESYPTPVTGCREGFLWCQSQTKCLPQAFPC